MSDQLWGYLEKFKDTYYADNQKKMVFKKQQKFDLADKISEVFDIGVLLDRAIYVVPGTNKLYFDYPVMKLFVNPNNYLELIRHTQALLPQCINQYGSFECHVDIHTFTATAAERHKELVRLFRDYDDGNIDYTDYLTKIVMLNTPVSMDVIAKILMKFIEPEIKAKIVLMKKEKSMV